MGQICHDERPSLQTACVQSFSYIPVCMQMLWCAVTHIQPQPVIGFVQVAVCKRLALPGVLQLHENMSSSCCTALHTHVIKADETRWKIIRHTNGCNWNTDLCVRLFSNHSTDPHDSPKIEQIQLIG